MREKVFLVAMCALWSVALAMSHEAGAGDTTARTYRVSVALEQLGPDAERWAAPALEVIAGREARTEIGSETQLGDERIFAGTQLKVKVTPTKNGQLAVAGTLEISTYGAAPDGEAYSRDAHSVIFKRNVTPGKMVRVSLFKSTSLLPQSKTADSERWLELTVHELTSDSRDAKSDN